MDRVDTPVVCDICRKTCGSRKAYTDHRRSAHALYYVAFSGPFIPYLLLSTAMELTLALDQKHVLRRDAASGPLFCHLCPNTLQASCDKIKLHYSKDHRLRVGVTLEHPGPPTSRAAVNPPPTPPSSNQNSQPEHDPDFEMAMDSLPLEGGLDGDDPEDDWEMESSYSDSSTDILDDSEEDTVVPASFTLPTSASSFPEDDLLIDEVQADPPQAPDAGTPSLLDTVYGSDSECFDSLKISAPSLTLSSQG